MDKIRNYAKTAVIYFIGNVFSKLVALFLLPLYTNRLEPYIMGEYDYAVTLLNFAAPICFFKIIIDIINNAITISANENACFFIIFSLLIIITKLT